eukprot:465085-Heterocapsa_arctica.AAC.1
MFFTPTAVAGLEGVWKQGSPGRTQAATRAKEEGSTREGRWRWWSQRSRNWDGRKTDPTPGSSMEEYMISGWIPQSSSSSSQFCTPRK